MNQWEKHKSLSLSFNFDTYTKNWNFTIVLFKNNGWRYTKFIPYIVNVEYSFWAWNWLCFQIYIDKKGASE